MCSAPTRLRALLVAVLLLLGPVACGRADEPDLLNDLASRLDRSGDLTYTAEYRLGSGGEAVLAQSQEPRRAAFVYPSGKSVATDTEVAACRTTTSGTTCTLSDAPSASTEPALDLLAESALDGQTPPTGLVSPAAAVRRLSAAVGDGATVTEYESTIAGEPVTCVGVHGSAGFTACFTARGVLGNFTGTVDGALVTFELTRFATTVEADTFALPSGAAIDDRRPR